MPRFALALVITCAALVTSLAQTATPSSPQALKPSNRQLGRINFPNSGNAAAQGDFLRGVAWLHSFGYEDAIDAFRAAQKADPSFALAYWGEAMSFSQPLWMFEEPEKGRAALAKLGATPAARIAKAKTGREQGFMRAVEALFGPGDKAARHAAAAAEMAKVAAASPTDDEAQAFYALALLATMPIGDASLPIRKQAGESAEAAVDAAWGLAFGRAPAEPQRRTALEYLRRSSLERLCLMIFNMSEFIYVD